MSKGKVCIREGSKWQRCLAVTFGNKGLSVGVGGIKTINIAQVESFVAIHAVGEDGCPQTILTQEPVTISLLTEELDAWLKLHGPMADKVVH